MTDLEKECALAALALRIETAKTKKERKEMREWYKEILNTPVTEHE
jgi:hypothetical protein